MERGHRHSPGPLSKCKNQPMSITQMEKNGKPITLKLTRTQALWLLKELQEIKAVDDRTAKAATPNSFGMVDSIKHGCAALQLVDQIESELF